MYGFFGKTCGMNQRIIKNSVVENGMNLENVLVKNKL
jgi:hypothetical protein